jgi:diguanylate cyclase (GGDEF)-like protein
MRTISLRAFVTVPFLILFLAAAGAIGAISYRSAQSATETLARQLVAEVGARIEARLQQFFAAPLSVVQLNLDAIRGGRLDPGQPDVLLQRFAEQARQMPQLTFVSLATEAGQYTAASRPPEAGGRPALMTALPADGLRLSTYALTDDGRPAGLQSTGAAYDARERPYYRLAARRAAPFWYPVYRYHAYDSLGVGLAAPVRDADGGLLGVLAADLALVEITRYLQTLPIGLAGRSFVAERGGELLAASGAEPVWQLQGDTFVRRSLGSHPDAAIRAADPLLRELGHGDVQHLITADGERYLLDLRRFTDAHGLDLAIGVLLPEREFTAGLEYGARQALLLTLMAIGIGACIGLILTRWIARPVERISARAERLAAGERGQAIATGTPVREINQLARSFERMATQLSGLIGQLEVRVAERTRDLERANGELARLSALDGLTRIANRGCFDDTLQREWQRACRDRAPLALVLCDIDHFKAFNDRYGHQRGDDALRATAQAIAGAARRPADLAARYGGEEFAMLLPGTDLAGAIEVGERLRQAVRAAGLLRDDLADGDRVTVSVGAACLVADHDLCSRDLLEAADRELYRAKQAGRDRVMPAAAPRRRPPRH